ncbi:MAG: sterol desaturase family protein [Deltaproteobacteria bacterium]|nr:sterol desaturase family protein [Deltaproteobacteria bacterium]
MDRTTDQRLWRRVVGGLCYPATLAITTALVTKPLLGGAAPMTVVIIALLGASALIWSLELLMPHREKWQPPRRTLLLDIAHTLVSSQLVAPLAKAGLIMLAAVIAHQQGQSGLGLWPSNWPFVAQFALAVVVADFPVYWAHRLMHVTSVGWRVHAVHHTPQHLHLWASARSHPFNVLIKVGGESGILLILGTPQPVFYTWLIFMSVHGLLQHANIAMYSQWLNRLLATPEVHRHHHSTVLEESCSNFGNTTMVWDQLFGSYQKPVAEEVGIGNYQVPERYWDHLRLPFALDRYQSPADSAQHD